MPIFLPVGGANRGLDRSVRHAVKNFCMISAVISINDFCSSSPLFKAASFDVKSGRLFKVMDRVEKELQSDMLVCSMIVPYVGLLSAVAHELFLLADGDERSGRTNWRTWLTR